jgi:hypothetical protein
MVSEAPSNHVLTQDCNHIMPIDPATQAKVLASLRALTKVAPGRSVEVRVPPYGAVQVIEGGTHRRGTPRAVIETDAATWLQLADGTLAWADALARGLVHASGERSDLSPYLPLTSQ